jgi:hypothetical protein
MSKAIYHAQGLVHVNVKIMLSLDIACLAQSITLSKSRQGMLSFIVTSIVFYRRIIEYHGVKRQAATKVDIMSVINRLSFMSLDTPDR